MQLILSMNNDFTDLLERQKEIDTIVQHLKVFESEKHKLTAKRGIYVYGSPGSGKTYFVNKILKELNYTIINYDAGDVRNKNAIEEMSKHTMSDKNVLSMFNPKSTKKIAIVMDEIDGMNSGDKGGINALIKIIRPKNNKKQRLEDITMNPIICIGNYHTDKKIKELMKVCHVVELKSPENIQISNICERFLKDNRFISHIVQYVKNDLNKLQSILSITNNDTFIFDNNCINQNLVAKSINSDTRNITIDLINNYHSLESHDHTMNETDRTIVGLLWHENIVDVLTKYPANISIPNYCDMLSNMCFADYIDRITFQKQIWQFNEMSSLVKTFKNNVILHRMNFDNHKLSEIRFTKVLTKYSTEYNNSTFVQSICQELNLEKKDLFAFFLYLKETQSVDYIYSLFENNNITKLDINRLFRYLDKYTKEYMPSENKRKCNETDIYEEDEESASYIE